MRPDNGVNEILAVDEAVVQILAVERVVDFVEAERRLDKQMKRLPKSLAQLQLLIAELVVLVQQPDLDYDFDNVVEQHLGLLLILCIVLDKLVQIVQYVAGGLVDEYFGHRLGRHLGGDLLLQPQCHRLRVGERGRGVVVLIVHFPSSNSFLALKYFYAI